MHVADTGRGIRQWQNDVTQWTGGGTYRAMPNNRRGRNNGASVGEPEAARRNRTNTSGIRAPGHQPGPNKRRSLLLIVADGRVGHAHARHNVLARTPRVLRESPSAARAKTLSVRESSVTIISDLSTFHVVYLSLTAGICTQTISSRYFGRALS